MSPTVKFTLSPDNAVRHYVGPQSVSIQMLLRCLFAHCFSCSLPSFQRPPWSTGSLIPASFLCGILSGVFIWKGGQKTKRIDKVRERLRAALAMEHPYGYGTDTEADETAMTVGATGQISIDKKGIAGGETEVDERMTIPPAGEKETS
jgi:hypothetical protein